MIARIRIHLPYSIVTAEKENYSIHEFSYDGYDIRIHPFERSKNADKYTDAHSMTINGDTAINMDTLRIEFQKKEFEEKKSHPDKTEYDPPAELIKKIANDFLTKLRYVTNANKVKLIAFPKGNWDLAYLNDDGTNLPAAQASNLNEWRGTVSDSLVALDSKIWDDIHSIPQDKALPAWKMLLLDAESLATEVGPAIILTFTALEVFISSTLDDIVKINNFDSNLWNWINNRSSLKNPSIEEKYDFLSQFLIGKSIKENIKLWEPFKNLQTARNKFAHNGIAMVGNEIVNERKVKFFILKATVIPQ